MSLSACIIGLVAEGKIPKAAADKAEREYTRHFNRLKGEMGMMAAAAEASELALKALEYDAALKKRQALLQVAAQARMASEIGASADPIRAPIAIVERVDYQHRAIVGRAHAMIEGVLHRHSRNLAGEARDKSGLADLVRELFGEATGNLSAKELAGGWREASEMLRQRFNRAGGNIGKRADWGLPQTHDMMKVRGAGYDAWAAFVAPRLDLGRMIDNATGEPFNPDSLDDALREVFESIRSDGWNKRSPGSQGQGKLANRRADHRFLVFKSADDWMGYQERFGASHAFDAMMGHVEGMARDIAAMEVMGPNPSASLRWLQDGIRQRAALGANAGEGALNRARSAEKAVGELFDVVRGTLNSPVNATAARWFGSVRSFLTSTLLGSAALSAITDVGFQAVTRSFNGLPIVGTIGGYLKLLDPLSAEDRRIAVRLGLIAEEASKMAAALNRFVDGQHGHEIARRLSDAVLRVSGLSPWTQAGRWAFGMEVLGHLADVSRSSWNNVDPALRRMMARHGIDESGWESIRATPLYEPKPGATFLRPDYVADAALGDALLRMVLVETDFAVPTATARARATLSFGQRPGTLGGELLRNAALFKSFGVSMLLTHGARMMSQKGYNRAKYFAGLTITTTLLGALAVQLKEVSRGRDAQAMADPGFWGRALLQGGGYGIFGDFVGSAVRENRFGGGLAETLAGPVVQAAGDASRAAGGSLGEDANPGAEAVKLLKRYTPGGSIWYARLAYERLLLDELQAEIDPDYYDSWRRVEDRADQLGQGYWWRPGDQAPDRLPEMAERPPE